MFSETFSQTLAMGFGSQASPQKAARTEEKCTCLPVTTKILTDAVTQMQGDELRIHGQELYMVLLVGTVESLVKQAASVEFVLNDSAGCVKVRQYFTDAAASASADKLVVGQRLSVVGSVRVAPELHVSAQFVNCMESDQDIRHHMVESIHAALKLRNTNESEVATPQKVVRPTPALVSATPAFAAAPASPVKPSVDAVMSSAGTGEQTLRGAVLAMLHKVVENAEGLSVSAIAQGLAPAKEEAVRSCLEALVDAGEAFNTIDDHHFNTFGTA